MIPNYVFDIASSLNKKNFKAYLVGGSVRDILMNRIPNDFDIVTNALPNETAEVFPKSVLTGEQFGTVSVIIRDQNGESQEVHVTTFRKEKDYVGGRWPSHVEFSNDLEEDLKRRDFTINAMAYDLSTGLQLSENMSGLIDLFGGRKDLEGKLIRAVGDATERLSEDGLRALRACRMASNFNYKLDSELKKAITEALNIVALISAERIRDELTKLIIKSPKPSYGIESMRETGLLKLILPELQDCYGITQNKYHVDDVYYHSLKALDLAPDEVKFAALFHDIAKPLTKEGEHFYGHDKKGAEMARKILERLKFDRKFIEKTTLLIRWHMFFIPLRGEDSLKELSESEYKIRKEERNEHFSLGWSDKAIRRMIRRVGGHDNLDDLIKLRIADAEANPKSSFDPTVVHVLAERVAQIRQQDSLLSVKDLKINGNDLMSEFKLPPGKILREVLEHLLEEVTEDINLNTKEKLLSIAGEYIDKKRSL